MGDPGSRNDPHAFELNRLDAEMVKQPDTAAQQHWHEVDVEFVEQSGLEALLRDARGADGNILVPGDFLGLCYRAFDAIADEGEDRILSCPFAGDGMGHDRHRDI